MPGRLDELSRAIGSIEESVRQLERRADEDRRQQEVRHSQNQMALAQIRESTQDAISEMRTAVTDAISKISQVQISTLQTSRSRMAGYAAVGIGVIVLGGWMVEAAVKFAVTWILTKFGTG